LKPERWGSLLVQENNQEEKACDKRRIIIIIIIIKLINVPVKPNTNFQPTATRFDFRIEPVSGSTKR
jgi:hypothetical protein